MTEDPARAAARKRLEAKRSFRGTAVTFVCVWILLIVIWAATGIDEFFWPVFPIAGMAIFLAVEAYGVYGAAGKPISEDEIDRELERGG